VLTHPDNNEGAAPTKKKLGFTLSSYPVDKVMPFTSTTFQQKNTNDPVELVACNFLSLILMHIHTSLF